MKTIVIAIALAAVGSCTTAASSGGVGSTEPPAGPLAVVPGVAVYGDSITAGVIDPPGWTEYLPFEVDNRGEPGAGFVWTGQWGGTILSNVFGDAAACQCLPETIYITGGANDVAFAPGLLDEALDNILGLQVWLNGHGVNSYFVTPPYMAGTYENRNPYLDQIHYLMETFHNVIDAGDILGRPLAPQYDRGDGVHLSQAGDIAFAGAVAP